MHLNSQAKKLVRSADLWKVIPLCWYTDFDTTLTNKATLNGKYGWNKVANAAGKEAEEKIIRRKCT